MDDTSSEQPSYFTEMRVGQVIQILLVGACAGALTWGLSYVLGLYTFRPAECAGTAIACVASYPPAVMIATIIAACIALFGLVRLQAFRPLLVVIAATICMWLVLAMLDTMVWYGSLALTALLFAVSYMVFAWIARIRAFWLVIIIDILLIVALRLVLTA